MKRFCVFTIICCLIFTLCAPTYAHAASKPYAEDGARMREAPDTDAKALHTLDPNCSITVKELSGSWYKIVYKGQTGYVYKTLIHNADGVSTVSTSSKTSAEQSTQAKRGVLQKGDKNDDVAELQSALKQLGFFDEDITGLFGNVTRQSVKDFQSAHGLTADGVAGPETLAAIKKTGASSTGTTTAKANSSGTSSTAQYAVSNAQTLKNGMVGDAVRTLQNALKSLGLFTAKVDGAYGDITETIVKEFQGMNGLDADGVAGPSTLSLLYSMAGVQAEQATATVKQSSTTVQTSSSAADTSGKPSNIELVEWYSEGKAAFTKKADARVYDVRTGRVFYVRSFSNGNHADVEPITAEDTAIIKSIYGGKWDWDPRPIFVTVSGRTFAAAINGMPHGGQTNYDNDMDGQLCIHFKGSLTHNGNTSYEKDFQEAVDEAWRAAR